MKGDFSRINFDPRKHHSGVLHQQGRVWLDADWNADVLSRLDRMEQQTVDVVGGCGVPGSPGTAFQIVPNATPGAALDDFVILGGSGPAGRAYVGGLLCRFEQVTTYLSQPDLPRAPRVPVPTDGTELYAVVYLEARQRLITYLEDDSVREVALGGPDTAVRLKTIAQVKVALLPPVLEVRTCELASRFIPTAGQGRLTTLQPIDTPPADPCRLPDPAAYSGRENALYRVEIHDGGDVLGGGFGAAFRRPLVQDAPRGAVSLVLAAPPTAEVAVLQAEAVRRSGLIWLVDTQGRYESIPVVAVSGDGVTISLSRALSSAANVADSAAVIGGAARFKWSRSNASFGVAVTAVSVDRLTITLASLGRDAASVLSQGDIIEITDEASELVLSRGHLTALASNPDPDQFTVTLADALPAGFGATVSGGATSPPSSGGGVRGLVLRRWDGVGTASAAFGETTTPDMNLGDGVHVQFDGADLRAGDYWQFAARAIDGSVERLDAAPPMGIIRHRCPLAIVRWGPPLSPPSSPPGSPPSTGVTSPPSVVFTVMQDCRNLFPPLIRFPRPDGGVHITEVVTSAPAGGSSLTLLNDTDIEPARLAAGIDLHCDAFIDPRSIARPTCYVTIEIPFEAQVKPKESKETAEKPSADKPDSADKTGDKTTPDKGPDKIGDKPIYADKVDKIPFEKIDQGEKSLIGDKTFGNDKFMTEKNTGYDKPDDKFGNFEGGGPKFGEGGGGPKFGEGGGPKVFEGDPKQIEGGTPKAFEGGGGGKVFEGGAGGKVFEGGGGKVFEGGGGKVFEGGGGKVFEGGGGRPKLAEGGGGRPKLAEGGGGFKVREVGGDIKVRESAGGGGLKVSERSDVKAREDAGVVRAFAAMAVGSPPGSPPDLSLPFGYQTITLAADVGAVGSVIAWRPRASTVAALPTLAALVPPGDRGLLARLTVKGNFVWAQNDATRLLDGDAFADPTAGPDIALALPSGDRRRGGDFEMWFWLMGGKIEAKENKDTKETKENKDTKESKDKEKDKDKDKEKESKDIGKSEKELKDGKEKEKEVSKDFGKEKELGKDFNKEKEQAKEKPENKEKVESFEGGGGGGGKFFPEGGGGGGKFFTEGGGGGKGQFEGGGGIKFAEGGRGGGIKLAEGGGGGLKLTEGGAGALIPGRSFIRSEERPPVGRGPLAVPLKVPQ